MYNRDRDSGKWFDSSQHMEKNVYDNYKQDQNKVRMYSNCLSGAVYFPTNNVDNIYGISKYKNTTSWFFGASSPYAIQQLPILDGKEITKENIATYKSFTRDYGMTVKNLFTTDKLIGSTLKNFYEVDLVTTSTDDLVILSSIISGIPNKEVFVDGIRLINGHNILIKDIMETISLPFDTDPNVYFIGNYYQIEDPNSSSNDYKIYGKDNGIYTYQDGHLLRTNAFDDYDTAFNLSVISKFGSNKGKQFHLSRLLNGTFPVIGMPIEFTSSKNWIIRNVFDYNNIYDVVLNCVIKTNQKTIFDNGITYDIKSRIISVGEFGTIINSEYVATIDSNRSHLINTKYKHTLNDIIETDRYYWTCGENGMLLKIDIITFDIINFDLGVVTGLNKIAFYDNLNGVVVGDFGEIYITTNGGESWYKQDVTGINDNMLYDVFFNKLNQIFVVGSNGLFVQLDVIDGSWKPWIKQVTKTINYYDEYLLHDDINSITYSDLAITVTGDDGYGMISPVTLDEYLIMCTSGGEVIIKCFNNKHEFIYIDLGIHQNARELFYNELNGSLYIVYDTIQRLVLNDFTMKIGGNTSDFVTSTTDPLTSEIIVNGYVNSIDLSDDLLYSCGNSSGLYMNDNTTINQDLVLVDSNYGNSNSSKLLFLDYDIASKLTFFGDDGKYVLPNTVDIPIVNLNRITFSNILGEYNWINYYMESLKKYEFYKQIDDSNVVNYSTVFDHKVGTYKLDSISEYVTSTLSSGSLKCLLTNDYSKFSQLLPNSNITDTSTFGMNAPKLNRNEFGQFNPTTSDLFTSFDFCVMMYKYMLIVKMPTDINNRIGSAFNINSALVDATMMVTKIHTYGNYDYLFMESDFNDSMIQSIIDSPSSFSITNLNIYSNIGELIENFKKHPISIGYYMNLDYDNINISGRFNNKTAYYNLQTKIEYDIDSTTHDTDMSYPSTFVKFGYSPTYNVLNYLSNINESIFNNNKVFTSMPLYNNLPLNSINNSTDDNIFIDFGRVNTNYISFGKNLSFEWETLWLHTFVDINLIREDGSIVSSEQMLIVKKYELDGRLIIELDKPISFIIGMTNFVTMNLYSRNTLIQISEDLQVMNNIQRVSNVKKIGSGYVTNLKNELSSKFPTDSYCKILLSDYDIKNNLSGIIYTDYNSNLAFNIIKIGHTSKLDINNAYQINDTVFFNLSSKHSAKVGDYVIIKSNGEYINPKWLGFASITEIVDENTLSIDKEWGTPSETGCNAILYHIDNDPFLNYQPVDIMDLGVDIDVKQATELKPSNLKRVDDITSLVGVNYSKYRYTCVDGLSVSIISEKFPWLLNAEISNAIIGYDDNGLIWYSGDWQDGRWFGSKWYGGRWFGGDWYSGEWNSRYTTYDNLSVSIGITNDLNSSVWYSGRWFGGTWNGGTWNGGRLYSVMWNGGVWNGGVWNDGVWNDGNFKGGIWVNGIWNNGVFNTDSKPAYWINGKWSGGDFENGRWFGGEFSEKTAKSRFGIKSSNTRNSIWDSGNWLGGEFHSSLSLSPTDGSPVQSDIHRFSYWKTGTWGGGNFYGGTAYNIRFKSGNWYGGISEDIEIVNCEVLLPKTNIITGTLSNKIRLNGVFRFNIDDEITICGTERSNIGSTKLPISYRVMSSFTDDLTYTELELVSLGELSNDFKMYLVFLKLEYAIRLGVTIHPLDIVFTGQSGSLNVYDHLKECVYGTIDGTKPTLTMLDLDVVNNLINSSIETSLIVDNIVVNFNRMDTELKVVSRFSNSDWYSGVWYNGVYDSGTFSGGTWYDGNFKGQWGQK